MGERKRGNFDSTNETVGCVDSVYREQDVCRLDARPGQRSWNWRVYQYRTFVPSEYRYQAIMSEPSSYNTFESEEENSGWLMSSEASIDDGDDDLSDELTLFNGDENSDEDALLNDDFIELSQRLKQKYKLQEATVGLERCDKIWDTMQLLKNIQKRYDSDDTFTDNEDDTEDADDELASSRSNSCVPETVNSTVPYIKYQPVQGNGNNALPNFYLAVKSQRKVYHCVTCGKQYSEKRGLRQHSEKEHGIVLPPDRHKTRIAGETRTLRPKTPSDVGSRNGRDSVADDKMVKNSSSRERDDSKSRLSNSSKQNSPDTELRRRRRLEVSVKDSAVGRAKQTGTRDLDQLLGASANDSPLCETTHANQQCLNRRSMEIHGISATNARKQMQINREEPAVAETKKETARNGEESSDRKGARDARTSREAASGSESLSDASKSSEVKRETSHGREKTWQPGKGAGPKFRTYRIIDGVKYRYLYTCKSCGKTFFARKSLKKHISRIHGLFVPPCKKGGFLEAARNSEIFKAELIKVDDEITTMRSGRSFCGNYSKVVDGKKGIERPRRACALRTSYTECTKEEEEELQKSLSGIPMSPVKSPPPSQTTNCVLCKKSFVDIRKHLVDYHRIHSPESILPLTTIAEPDKIMNPVASEEAVDTRQKPKEEKMEKQHKQSSQRKKKSKASIEAGEDPRIAVVFDTNGQKGFQCVVCSFKYKYIHTILRHLKQNTVNGVVKAHKTYTGYHAMRSKQKDSVSKDPIADPLAFSDASKTNSNCNTSEDNDFSSVIRKRMISSSDERFTPSPEPETKRRKIEDSETDGDANNGLESRSDSVQDNVEEGSVMALSESDSRSIEEVKCLIHRDTRDSSDRDSGIGISITIKKRNDSYEVVEKDGGDDAKSKDFENSKDDHLLCSDSSSDVTPVDFVSYNQETRRNEILNSIDYSKDENILGSMRMVSGGVENEKKTENRCSSNDADNNFHWKEGCYREEVCTNMRGKVPSLKALCRTALTIEELSMSTSNNVSLSHECPMCYRFYPTERDVTIHMLEHKVSRSNFRTTRLHIISSSALRRYGRRPVRVEYLGDYSHPQKCGPSTKR